MGKRCSHCRATKPSDEFGAHRSRPDGRADWCLSCTRDYERARRADPAYRAVLAARARERRKRPEVKARIAQMDAVRKAADPLWHRKYTQTEDYRARCRARIKTPEGRERNRIVQANRRARARHGESSRLSEAEWKAVKADFGDACAYCLVSGVELQIEHLQPLVKGGEHARSNIVPACRECNQSKNRRDLVQFLAYSTGVAI